LQHATEAVDHVAVVAIDDISIGRPAAPFEPRLSMSRGGGHLISSPKQQLESTTSCYEIVVVDDQARSSRCGVEVVTAGIRK
jgi:hypothetical protein